MADDEIIFKFLVETSEAVQGTIELGKEIEKVKEIIRSVAIQSGESFDLVAQKMKEIAESRIGEGKDPTDVNSKGITAEQVAKETALLSKAVASLRADERAAAGQAQDEAKEMVAAEVEKQNAIKATQAAQYQAQEQQMKTAREMYAYTEQQEKEQQARRVDAAKQEVQLELERRKQLQKSASEEYQDEQARRKSVAETYQYEQSQIQMVERLKRDMAEQEIKLALLRRKEAERAAEEDRKFQQQLQEHLDAPAKTQQKIDEAAAQARNAQYSKEAKDIAKGMKEGEASATGFAGALQKLGTVGQFVFGTVLGMSAVGMIQSLISAFKGAVASGVEYSKELWKLGASTRALQRNGMDISIKEVADQVKNLRQQYAFFSQREAVQAVGSTQMLMRSFGLTKDQLKQATEAAVTLSVVTGRDVGEAARELALFMSSGYAESMQSAGLAVNRVTVAQEAMRLGFGDDYQALTENQRATAALSLVRKELKSVTSEVTDYEKSLAGQIDATTAAMEDQTDMLSLKLAPLQLELVKFQSMLVDALSWLAKSYLSGIGKVIDEFVALFLAGLTTTMVAITAATNGITLGMDGMGKVMIDTQKKYLDIFAQRREEIIKNFDLSMALGPDAPIGPKPTGGGGDPDGLEERKALLTKFLRDALKMEQDYRKERDKIQREYKADIGSGDIWKQLDNVTAAWDQFFSNQENTTREKTADQKAEWEHWMGDFGSILDEGLLDALKIWQKYYAKLDEINAKEQEKITDENASYAQKQEDLARDTQQKLDDAARKYREEELKAERDYQEKLRRLREEYLFDLEDALRERDALQVLRLMRRYQLDKEQLEREHENDAKDRAEAYRREIEDIRRQAARKAEELRIEHQRRLEEIRAQAEKERQEAYDQREQERAELIQKLLDEKAERDTAYAQEIADLKQKFADRMSEVFIGLTDEKGMTDQLLKEIGQLYLDMFGKDGMVDISYQELQKTIAKAVADAQAALAQILNIQAQVDAAAANIQNTTSSSGDRYDQMNNGAPTTPPSSSPPPSSTTTPPPSSSTPSSSSGGLQIDPRNFALQFAEGGTAFANKPTPVLFGEAGPELATFTPLSHLNTNNLGLPNGMASKGAGGSARVQIYLAPGLKGEIIDGAMDGVAQIFEQGRRL